MEDSIGERGACEGQPMSEGSVNKAGGRKIKTLQDVVEWGLCIGCGACSYACTKTNVSLVNILSEGIRPQFEIADACGSCTQCLSFCPGYVVDADLHRAPGNEKRPSEHEFGAALEIWEGHASDPEIRFQASSGGLLSAIAIYCLEREGMGFVLHSGADEEAPWVNRTVQSRNRAEMLSRAGSRYSPSSPCDSLASIESSDSPCVFIGKPCDTAAVSVLRWQRPALAQNLGLVMTFFCAGTPSSKGTLDLAAHLNVDREGIDSISYRGEGWPGDFRVHSAGSSVEKTLGYQQSWAYLTSYRPLRCNLCPDGLGRIADISCGDSWGKWRNDGDPGRSLVLVRTERGREILHGAIAAHYVSLERVDSRAVMEAQPQLLQRRRELFGRLLALRLVGAPIPRFKKFSLFRSWLALPPLSQARTLLGTMRRAIRRGWWKRRSPSAS